MQKRRTICIDLDGVLADWDGEWRGEQHQGKPLPGAKEFLEKLVAANIDFVVLTTRESKEQVLAWFKKHELPLPKDVTNRKIKATAYIDDRAVYFDGNFDHLLQSLEEFRVHWKEEKPLKSLLK